MPGKSADTPGLLPDSSFPLSPDWYLSASRPQEQNRAWRISLEALARWLDGRKHTTTLDLGDHDIDNLGDRELDGGIY